MILAQIAQQTSAQSDIGATSILIGIAVLFGIYAMMKGLAKLIFSLLGIGAGLAASYFAYVNSDKIIAKLKVTPEPWMPYAVAAVAGIGASFALHSFARTFLLKPRDHHGNRKFGFGLKAGILGLLVGVVIVASGMSGLRYADAIAQLKQFKTSLVTGTAQDPSAISKLRNFLDQCKAGQWLQKADPINDPDKLKAAKVLVMQSLMTPDRLEGLAPLAQGFAGNGASGINAALAGSPEIRDRIAEEDFAAILESDAIREMLKDPLVRKHIHELDLEVLINGDNGWRSLYE